MRGRPLTMEDWKTPTLKLLTHRRPQLQAILHVSWVGFHKRDIALRKRVALPEALGKYRASGILGTWPGHNVTADCQQVHPTN